MVKQTHLRLDKGYDNPTGGGKRVDRDYVPRIIPIRDERPHSPKR